MTDLNLTFAPLLPWPLLAALAKKIRGRRKK
jgi:hypothetical protein